MSTESVAAPRRVIVLGAGAIGASLGALLFEAGVPVTLVARGAQARVLAEAGVDLRFPDGARQVRVPVVARIEALAVDSRDLVLLATMAHHSLLALAPVDPAVPVACFQNGLRSVEDVAGRGHPTLGAMVFVAAERRGPGRVALAGAPTVGAVMVGGWPGGCPPLATWLAGALARAGLKASAEADIAPWLRAKVLTNLGGLVVALCDDPPKDVVAAAQEEARAAWRAAGLPFHEIGALMDWIGPMRFAPVDGQERRGGSTRAALARGEPLESVALHGDIVETARRCGREAPVNAGLARLAEQAVREGWAPGAMSAEALRGALRAPGAAPLQGAAGGKGSSGSR